jgi:hypothetical protein
MLTQSDLKRVYDIAVDSLEDGLAKSIFSSSRYKANIYKKIDQEYKKIIKARSIIKDMYVNTDILPMCSVIGEMHITTKDNGDEVMKFEFIKNEDIFWKLLNN